jgi:hypothetical protein
MRIVANGQAARGGGVAALFFAAANSQTLTFRLDFTRATRRQGGLGGQSPPEKRRAASDQSKQAGETRNGACNLGATATPLEAMTDELNYTNKPVEARQDANDGTA